MSQMEMVDLDSLVPSTHPYRRVQGYRPDTTEVLADVSQLKGADGYGVERLFRCLLLQFMEDLSDRELERYLEENLAAKWFCGFTLSEPTPAYSLFTRVRTRLGPTRLSQLFATMRAQLKAAGLMSEVFTFVDATHLIAQATLWEERDKARQQKIDKLNNEVLPKVAVDKQARIGCKGQQKYWYGYKEHVSVDMQSGLMNKVATTPANLPDAQGLRHVCPTQGAIYGEKGYCTAPARQAAAYRGCHLATVHRNNMKTKNRDRDRWYTHLRAPYERVVAQWPKRVRYRGVAKNQFAAFLQAMALNLKRLLSLEPSPMSAGAKDRSEASTTPNGLDTIRTTKKKPQVVGERGPGYPPRPSQGECSRKWLLRMAHVPFFNTPRYRWGNPFPQRGNHDTGISHSSLLYDER